MRSERSLVSVTRSVVDSALDGWFTTGRFAKEFERKLARFVGVRSASLVNSGSSANLVALSALTSPKLGDRQLKPGDEVITVAAGFPTTVNPILQNRLVPVFLDVTLPTYEIDCPAQRRRNGGDSRSGERSSAARRSRPPRPGLRSGAISSGTVGSAGTGGR